MLGQNPDDKHQVKISCLIQNDDHNPKAENTLQSTDFCRNCMGVGVVYKPLFTIAVHSYTALPYHQDSF